MLICSHGASCNLLPIQVHSIQAYFEENLRTIIERSNTNVYVSTPRKIDIKCDPTAPASTETSTQQSNWQQINQKRRRRWRHGAAADEENVWIAAVYFVVCQHLWSDYVSVFLESVREMDKMVLGLNFPNISWAVSLYAVTLCCKSHFLYFETNNYKAVSLVITCNRLIAAKTRHNHVFDWTPT